MPTLEFKGKPFVYSHHLSVPFRELIVDKKKSFPGGAKASLDDNLIIHGDNLEALKALLPRYAGKVDVIYIDPPYNTGNEGWAYNDAVNSPLMKAWLGKVVDRDDLERHDKWLCMMWPRLQLMKELLSDTGSIWINLDDTEAHSAKIICDEIFGARNFVTTVVWQKMDSPSRNEAERAFSNYHDFLLVYANDKDSVELSRQLRQSIIDAYPLEWKEGRRARRRQLRKNGKSARRQDRPTLWYELKAPDGTVVWPIAPEGWEGRWVLKKGEWARREAAGLTEWIKRDYGWVPYVIEVSPLDPQAPWSTIWSDVDQNRQAKAEVKEILGGDYFDTPKPSRLVERILEIAADPDALVLDSFAGSGTTAHATLALNKRTSAERRFIVVQLPEKVGQGSPAFEKGYRDVVDIACDRVRKVIGGVASSKDAERKAGLGGSFTYCTLGDALDLERFFDGKGAPAYTQVARYVVYTATGQSVSDTPEEPKKDWFVAEAGGYRIHLIYRPDLAFMRGNDAALSMDMAQAIAKGAKGKPALVYAAAKFMAQEKLTKLGLTFCQLPYAVHRILGEAPDAP